MITKFFKNFTPTPKERLEVNKNLKSLEQLLPSTSQICCCLEKKDASSKKIDINFNAHTTAGHFNTSSKNTDFSSGFSKVLKSIFQQLILWHKERFEETHDGSSNVTRDYFSHYPSQCFSEQCPLYKKEEN